MSIPACVTVLVGILLIGECSHAAEPPQIEPSATKMHMPVLGVFVATHPASQLNTFEIAPYLRDNQKFEQDNLNFDIALQEIPHWRSKIDESDKNMRALRNACEQNNTAYCDVVSLIETGAGKNTMSLEIFVYTTPQAHRAIHTGSLDINGKTEDCNKQSMGEDLCRKLLMKQVVIMLAGLDKLHPSPDGDK